MSRKYTYEDVKKFVSENSTCTLISAQYSGVFGKLSFRCSCGQEFATDFHHFKTQNQRQCPTCGFAKARLAQRLTEEEVNARLAQIGCELISEYKGRKNPVDIRCSCGHIKRMRVNTALTNNFSGLCQDCSDEKFRGRNRFTTEQVRAMCAELGVEMVTPEYKTIKDPMEFMCACGRTFVTTFEIAAYYRKTRCDYCTRQMSFGEQKVASWLAENGFQYEYQKKFEGCGGPVRKYRFDFYLPSANTCIEFDGQQHFKTVDFAGTGEEERLLNTLLDTVSRDMTKTQYCEDNGITLIRIRFDETDRISEILSSKLIPR